MKHRLPSAPLTDEDILVWALLRDGVPHERWRASNVADRRDADHMLYFGTVFRDADRRDADLMFCIAMNRDQGTDLEDGDIRWSLQALVLDMAQVRYPWRPIDWNALCNNITK